MDVQQVFHVNDGTGENSYSNNSSLQKMGMTKGKSIVEDTVLDLYCTTFPKSSNIADLGCSTGPYALLMITEIKDAINEGCRGLSCCLPELNVFLNDLPGNDFNTIFKSLPFFCKTLNKEKGYSCGPCFIAGVPSSFYERLFPSNSLHFVHASYSVHLLSQVPEGLDDEKGVAMKRGMRIWPSPALHVCSKLVWSNSREISHFFSSCMRSEEEVISGGRMVLMLFGRTSEDHSSVECRHIWELLAQALMEMVSQGVVEEAKLDSFNLPLYTPSTCELKAVINMEGSFSLDRLETFEMDWDPEDNNDDNEGFVFAQFISGQNVANHIRSVVESMLTNHFGEALMDDLFKKYGEKVAQHPAKEKTKNVTLAVSMTKKVQSSRDGYRCNM